MNIQTLNSAIRKKEFERADNLFREHFSDSQDPMVWYLFGLLNVQRGSVGIAAEGFRKSIQLDSKIEPSYGNLIACLKKLGRLEEAEKVAGDAAARFRDNWGYRLQKGKDTKHAAALLVNYGSTLLELAKFEEAENAYIEALKYEGNNPDAHWNLGLLNLSKGNWDGWSGYEWGFNRGERQTRPYTDEHKIWNGEDLTDKTILVWGEQGLGDEILFSSCLRDLKAKQVIFDCHPRLGMVFHRSFPDIIVSPTRKNDAPGLFDDFEIDYIVSVGSLPRFFRTKGEFDRSPWLKPDEQKVNEWKTLLGENIVGLSWRGGSPKTLTFKRSMTLETLANALDVPNRKGVTFVSLQYGDGTFEEVDAYNKTYGTDIKCHEWAVEEYTENFNLTASCDLVVSVLTAACDVSGSLGVPVWALVPFSRPWKYRPDSESWWYESMTHYHQPGLYEWKPVLDQIGNDFENWTVQNRSS